MSYPEPRYDGGGGELSAMFRPVATPPELVGRTSRVSYLATTDSTGGEFGLYRYEMTAEPSGPAAHYHRTISESFFVLDGTIRLFDGAEWVDAVAGDFLYVPVGGIHAFRNESGAPATMLLLFAPSAPREKYFESLVEMAASGRQLSPDEYTAFLAEHDQYMV